VLSRLSTDILEIYR